jgi:hypothetical protein
MLTIKEMGYQKEGLVFVKHIGNYEIQITQTANPKIFIRRTTLNGAVKDIRKVNIYNLEKDNFFMEILKQKIPGIQSKPTQQGIFKEEVTLKSRLQLKLNGAEKTKEKQIGFVDSERLLKRNEVNLNKKRGV